MTTTTSPQTSSTFQLIPAILSFVLPGLGQLVQLRLLAAFAFFMLDALIVVLVAGSIAFDLLGSTGSMTSLVLSVGGLMMLGVNSLAAYDAGKGRR